MRRLIIIFLGLSIFTSCKIMQPNKMFKVPDNYNYSEFKPAQQEYIIQPFDKLTVQIYTNDGIDLIYAGSKQNNRLLSNNSIEYLVEFDGMVKVPVLGRIKISELTVKQAEQLLEDKYSTYYKKPFVIIHVVNRRVIVFSQGSSSGAVIPLTEENFTLVEAIAQAGGISDYSKSYKIKLIRGNLNKPEVYLFNLSKISDLENVNLLLEANDIIYVETRQKYASRIISELSPYMSLLTIFLLIRQQLIQP